MGKSQFNFVKFVWHFFILRIFVFVSLSLSNCHYYVSHYYEIIMHYFSNFTFFLGHLSFVSYYCPTTNKYSLQNLSLYYNFIHNSLLTISDISSCREKKKKHTHTHTHTDSQTHRSTYLNLIHNPPPRLRKKKKNTTIPYDKFTNFG